MKIFALRETVANFVMDTIRFAAMEHLLRLVRLHIEKDNNFEFKTIIFLNIHLGFFDGIFSRY